MNNDAKYNSTHGSRTSTKTETVRISRKNFTKCMSAFLITGALIGGLSATQVPKLVENFQQKSEVVSVLSEYQSDIVTDNTHRTDEKDGYWYDYGDMALKLVQDETNMDEKLYAVYADIGEENTNEVVRYLNEDYKTIDEYIEQKGYSDADEWKESINKKILLELQQEKIDSELKQMSSDYENAKTNNSVDASYGGK